ncbi:MAG: hypothetical protein M1812_000838 [Candelaria pacifica]|nr:MAG: hypothetical protein M1812_000838 [Candelaria pacifica]
MDKYEVSDSTDWLQTSLSSFAPVEAALRCQVCKDFFDTPMITSCSHTFCSICIRRCLTSDGKCPACRAGEQEMRLRRNWTVQELVDSFQSARPDLLKLASNAAASSTEKARRTPKRKLEDTDLEIEDSERMSQARKTRSQSRRSPALQSNDPVVILDDEEDDDYQPEDGLVPCPICQRRMKPEEVYPHLDRCEGESNTSHTKPDKPRQSPARKPTLHRPPSQLQKHPPERLPKLNYSLLKDTLIRKKFQELGIPAWGSKPLLIKRHTEWVNLWNANCDSSRPRTKREVLQDLDIWERSQGGHAPNTNGALNSGGSLMKKDFDGAGWAASHSEDFQQLIANARKKKSAPSPKAETPKSNSVEEESTEIQAMYLLKPAESSTPEGPNDETGNEESNPTATSLTIDDSIINPEDEPQTSLSKDNISPPQQPSENLLNPPRSPITSPHFLPPSSKKRILDDNIQDRNINTASSTSPVG